MLVSDQQFRKDPEHINVLIQGRVKCGVERTPDHIQTEAELALESNSLHRGHLPGSNPVHEVPEPLSFLRDLSNMIVEELPLDTLGHLVQGNPVVHGIHLQSNALSMSTVSNHQDFEYIHILLVLATRNHADATASTTWETTIETSPS